MKKEIKVVVFNSDDSCSEQDTPPDNVRGHIAWLEGKMALIPEEYRSNATIEQGYEPDGDGGFMARLYIYYYRPETDEEENERIKRQVMANRRMEQMEIQEFYALKKKLGL